MSTGSRSWLARGEAPPQRPLTASFAQRVVELQGGRIVSDKPTNAALAGSRQPPRRVLRSGAGEAYRHHRVAARHPGGAPPRQAREGEVGEAIEQRPPRGTAPRRGGRARARRGCCRRGGGAGARSGRASIPAARRGHARSGGTAGRSAASRRTLRVSQRWSPGDRRYLHPRVVEPVTAIRTIDGLPATAARAIYRVVCHPLRVKER